MDRRGSRRLVLLVLLALSLAGLPACTGPSEQGLKSQPMLSVEDTPYGPGGPGLAGDAAAGEADDNQAGGLANQGDAPGSGSGAMPAVDIHQDLRPGFDHGPKGAEHQRYIVIHDTEGDSDPAAVIDWWDSNGNLVAAHFVIGKDGSIYQCVPIDRIAHHAGFGNTGHNAEFGISEDGRDDMLGSVRLGSSHADYAMNAHSIGIELVHVGGSGYYPPEQLEALTELIAYIDDYYGFESQIIDHKAWVNSNPDTSPEFAGYLRNYQDHRSYN